VKELQSTGSHCSLELAAQAEILAVPLRELLGDIERISNVPLKLIFESHNTGTDVQLMG
jgi:hypothetical protein